MPTADLSLFWQFQFGIMEGNDLRFLAQSEVKLAARSMRLSKVAIGKVLDAWKREAGVVDLDLYADDGDGVYIDHARRLLTQVGLCTTC